MDFPPQENARMLGTFGESAYVPYYVTRENTPRDDFQGRFSPKSRVPHKENGDLVLEKSRRDHSVDTSPGVFLKKCSRPFARKSSLKFIPRGVCCIALSYSKHVHKVVFYRCLTLKHENCPGQKRKQNQFMFQRLSSWHGELYMCTKKLQPRPKVALRSRRVPPVSCVLSKHPPEKSSKKHVHCSSRNKTDMEIPCRHLSAAAALSYVLMPNATCNDRWQSSHRFDQSYQRSILSKINPIKDQSDRTSIWSKINLIKHQSDRTSIWSKITLIKAQSDQGPIQSNKG